jgi:hypothetical protein
MTILYFHRTITGTATLLQGLNKLSFILLKRV